jgi:hypothetical protein
MRFLSQVALLLIVAAPTAHAQIGVKAGLSFASTTESDFLPDVGTRTGFAAGVSLGLPLSSALSLKPEALFVQKGGKYSTNQEIEINELNVPVLLTITLPIPGVSPFVQAGPVAEFELSCKAANLDCVESESLRWGFAAGAGIQLGGALTVEARYGFTLSEISDDIRSKPRTILLLLGLQLGGG